MSAINKEMLNPDQQRALDKTEANLRAIIPSEFFRQAEDIVSENARQYSEDIVLFKRGPKIRNDVDEKIVDLYIENNLSLRDIAKILGRSHQGVGLVLERNGIPLRPPGRAPGYENMHLPTDKIVKEYQEGSGSIALGKEHGVSPRTILRLIIKAGVESRRRGSPPRDLDDNLINEMAQVYLEEGKTLSELAEQYGFSAMTIQRWFKEKEVARHSRGFRRTR